MKIEFRNSGKTHYSGEEIYHLYIDNKTDFFDYNEDGEGAYIYPKNIKQKHIGLLKQIPCADIPAGMKIWNTIFLKIALGTISVFEITRWGKKTKISFWYELTEYKKYPCNPFILLDSIKRKLKDAGIKQAYLDTDEPMPKLEIEYMSDLQGTIGDKINAGKTLISNIVKKAQEQQIAKVKSYLLL